MSRKLHFIIVASLFMLSEVPDIHARGSQSFGSLKSDEPCLFTIQLRDPLIKRQYIAKITAVAQRNEFDSLTADDMYNDIRRASLEEYDEGDLNYPSKGRSAAMKSLTGIDDLSIICLGCHDGAAAQSVDANVRNDPFNRRSTIDSASFEHPIGMDYRRYASSGRDYKWISINSTKMIFVDGKVGCLTCHDPINPEKGHLVMSDRRSALCLTCHNK
jgi:predicted CXXCH cytochrome family protein